MEKVLWNSNDDENNPTFDGAEFCGDKPLTRQTLNKMLKMLRVPEHRWNKIVDKELLERNTVRRFMKDFWCKQINKIDIVNIILLDYIISENHKGIILQIACIRYVYYPS